MWKIVLLLVGVVFLTACESEQPGFLMVGGSGSVTINNFTNNVTTINNFTNNITNNITTTNNVNVTDQSYQCVGGNDEYIYNVTWLNGIASYLCAADSTGSASADGTGGWTNSSLETNTSLDVNIYNNLYIKGGDGKIVGTPGAGSAAILVQSTATGGVINFGNNAAAIGISDDGVISGYNYGGAFILRQKGTDPVENGEFIFIEESGSWRFALPKSLAQLGTYNPRSMIIAGPSTNDNRSFNCSYWGFTSIDCATSVTGADLGVQDDAQIKGKLYVNEYIYANNLTVLNLTSANCDVKAYTDGTLYCGTDATGSGGDGTGGWINTSLNTTTNLNVTTTNYFLDKTGFVAVSNKDATYFANYEWEFLNAGPSIFDPILGSAISSGVLNSNIPGTPEQPGIIRLNDSTTAGGGYRILSEVNSFLINTSEYATFIFRPMKFLAGASTTTTRLGFIDTTTASAPTDGCYYEITNLTLSGRCRNNAGPTITNPTYTLNNYTWYKGTINIINATHVNFSIYTLPNTLVWSGNVSGNLPLITGRETGFGIVSTEDTTGITGTGIIDFDYMSLKIKKPMLR